MKKITIVLLSVLIFSACKNDKETKENENDKKTEQLDNQEVGVQNETSGNEVAETEEPGLTSVHQNEDGSYSFRYNLIKGETYPFALVINQDQKMSAMGQNINLQASRTVVFDYLVEDVENNQFKIKATFKKFSESSKTPEGSISYDTNNPKPADKDVAQSWSVYKSIAGESFNMVINNKGKVVSISGLPKVIDSAMKKLAGDFGLDDQKQIRKLLENSLSDASITSQFEESMNIFPDKAMKIGEKWEDSQKINEGPVKGENKLTRTFKEIKDGRATIVVSGVQDVSGTETEKNSGITASMKNHATIEGFIDLDYKTGWIKKAKITKSEKITTVYSRDDKKETENSSQTVTTTVN